jgi:hypothetical protein
MGETAASPAGQSGEKLQCYANNNFPIRLQKDKISRLGYNRLEVFYGKDPGYPL